MAITTRKVRVKPKKQCGLCGKTRKLYKTDCCDNWICDDEDKYVLFSYARNSCSRNHRRFTLCSYHHIEKHRGNWQACEKCKRGFETEMYVWYGTNEYNFTKLENPPAFKPTHCKRCNVIISLSEDAHASIPNEGYVCERCEPMPR